jgi:hypothetical protein
MMALGLRRFGDLMVISRWVVGRRRRKRLRIWLGLSVLSSEHDR